MSEGAAERYLRLRGEIERELRECGRRPGGVTVVGVGKGQPVEALTAAIAAGLEDLGENYLQEARRQFAALPPVRKHFIGHVQTNKAKGIAAAFDVVQSVDRPEAGAALSKAARQLEKPLAVLLQLNVSPAERFGCAPADAPGVGRDAPRPAVPAPRGRHGRRTARRGSFGDRARFRAGRHDVCRHRWKYAFNRHVGRLA